MCLDVRGIHSRDAFPGGATAHLDDEGGLVCLDVSGPSHCGRISRRANGHTWRWRSRGWGEGLAGLDAKRGRHFQAALGTRTCTAMR